MNEWKECKLGEVVQFRNGKSRPSEIEKGTIPIYGGNGILGYTDKFNCENETVIVGRVGAFCGSVYYENKPIWVSDNALYTIPKNSTNIKFLYYLLKNMELNYQAEGSSHPLLTQTLLNSLDIFITDSISEQRAIAGVLSSLDGKIDLLHRQNKTLEAMAEALWRKMFIEEAKDTWIKGAVKDMINILSGFAFKSPDFIDNGKYRLITIKNVQDGYLDLSRTDYLGVIPDGMPDYCFLRKGDILLSLTGNVGRCCLVNEENLLLNQRVSKLQVRNVRDSAFTYMMFRQKTMRSILEELAKGTAQANLSPVETASYEIQIPPDDLLENYSAEATPLMEKVLNNFNQIRTLSHLRDMLLPKLMSGEIRVKV